MKKHIALATLTVASLMMTAGLVSAATISTPTYSPGTTWNVYSFEAWYTTGNTMDGMTVTAKYQDGSETTGVWGDNSGASGAGWSLTMNDYTANTWNLAPYSGSTWWIFTYDNNQNSNKVITSLIIDGKPGNTVFDYILEAVGATDYHTPGSYDGRLIYTDNTNNPPLLVDVEYSNYVTLNGIYWGDLYHTISFDFSKSGGLTQGVFKFSLDTDNVNPVPEPATMLLFGIGAMSIAAFRKRKDN